MKCIRILSASLLAVLLLAFPSTASATTCVGMEPLKPVHRICGVVFLPNGRRIANAVVSVRQGDEEIAVKKTDDDGKFSFDELKPGHYELRIRLEDLRSGVAGTKVVLAHPNLKSKKEIAVSFNPLSPGCSVYSIEDAKQFEAGLNPDDSELY